MRHRKVLSCLPFSAVSVAPMFAQGHDAFNKPFPPFKVIGNIYYVGTARSRLLPDHHAGRQYPDQQRLRRYGSADQASVEKMLQVHKHQDSDDYSYRQRVRPLRVNRRSPAFYS
jgi:hypothetical protein